ncbi:uncharacterized protein LOC112166210 [Rosa chinensis]|uniref:uncharacterized protein LOC112166210 n=1 Tax=Rosa chinensis TaxID=74649 RepID=UPI001AD8E4DE|nr:uncharacterized protein LOC112166210 [Rosa chinensis]
MREKGGTIELPKSTTLEPINSSAVGRQRSSKLWYSSSSTDSDTNDTKKVGAEEDFDDFLRWLERYEMEARVVDPKRGWGFHGVHKGWKESASYMLLFDHIQDYISTATSVTLFFSYHPIFQWQPPDQ